MFINLKNGTKVDAEYLDNLESCGFSEEKIASILHISRMGLWKVRKRLNCKQKSRSDKGILKKEPKEKKERPPMRESRRELLDILKKRKENGKGKRVSG